MTSHTLKTIFTKESRLPAVQGNHCAIFSCFTKILELITDNRLSEEVYCFS
jgi:hypothetical protein